MVVPVTLTEFRVEHPPVGGGRTIFRVKNDGSLRHELNLISLPEDLPPIDVQIRSSERVFVDAVATLAPRPPGAAGTFAADLQPGRYALVCFLNDGDGEQHIFKGMSSEFRVH